MRNKGFLGCSNYPGCNKTINYIEILNHLIECPECGDISLNVRADLVNLWAVLTIRNVSIKKIWSKFNHG